MFVSVLCVLLGMYLPPEQSPTASTRLYIRTEPSGALIEVNGQSLGRSDGLFSVPPGETTITISLDGYENAVESVTVEGSRITRVTVRLKPKVAPPSSTPTEKTNPAEIAAKTSPPGAEAGEASRFSLLDADFSYGWKTGATYFYHFNINSRYAQQKVHIEGDFNYRANRLIPSSSGLNDTETECGYFFRLKKGREPFNDRNPNGKDAESPSRDMIALLDVLQRAYPESSSGLFVAETTGRIDRSGDIFPMPLFLGNITSLFIFPIENTARQIDIGPLYAQVKPQTTPNLSGNPIDDIDFPSAIPPIPGRRLGPSLFRQEEARTTPAMSADEKDAFEIVRMDDAKIVLKRRYAIQLGGIPSFPSCEVELTGEVVFDRVKKIVSSYNAQGDLKNGEAVVPIDVKFVLQEMREPELQFASKSSLHNASEENK